MQNERSQGSKGFWKKVGGYIRPFIGIAVIAWAIWRMYIVFFVDAKFGPETWLRLAFSGLVIGGMYSLVAIGYSLVYGILGMINFAHGEVMMVGSFAGYFFLQALKTWPTPTANKPNNFSECVSLVLDYSCICCWYDYLLQPLDISSKKLLTAPSQCTRLVPLISAIGASIFLQNAVQLLIQSSTS